PGARGEGARRPRALEGNPRQDVREASLQAHRRSFRSLGPRLLSCVGTCFVRQRNGDCDRRRRFDASEGLKGPKLHRQGRQGHKGTGTASPPNRKGREGYIQKPKGAKETRQRW